MRPRRIWQDDKPLARDSTLRMVHDHYGLEENVPAVWGLDHRGKRIYVTHPDNAPPGLRTGVAPRLTVLFEDDRLEHDVSVYCGWLPTSSGVVCTLYAHGGHLLRVIP